MVPAHPIEPCPRCGAVSSVVHKVLLLNKGHPSEASSPLRSACSDHGGFTVQGLKAEFAVEGSTAQFVQGLYCETCDIGFIPESMAKPAAPAYRPVSGGWRRVLEDGTLGPLLKRIAADTDR